MEGEANAMKASNDCNHQWIIATYKQRRNVRIGRSINSRAMKERKWQMHSIGKANTIMQVSDNCHL